MLKLGRVPNDATRAQVDQASDGEDGIDFYCFLRIFSRSSDLPTKTKRDIQEKRHGTHNSESIRTFMKANEGNSAHTGKSDSLGTSRKSRSFKGGTGTTSKGRFDKSDDGSKISDDKSDDEIILSSTEEEDFTPNHRNSRRRKKSSRRRKKSRKERK
jgi:hypothetical protein